MPFEVRWYAEPRVIYTRLWGDVTVEESRALNEHTLDLIRTGQSRVHVIVDMHEVENYPLNIRRVSEVSPFLRDRDVGWIVAVSSKHMLSFLASVVTQLSRSRFRNVPTLEAAREFLLEQDPSLEGLFPDVAPD